METIATTPAGDANCAKGHPLLSRRRGQPLIDLRALEALAAVIPGDVRASGEPALRDGGAEFMASLAG